MNDCNILDLTPLSAFKMSGYPLRRTGGPSAPIFYRAIVAIISK